jgi:hypothetical protein
MKARSGTLERKRFLSTFFDFGGLISGKGMRGELDLLLGFLGWDAMLIGALDLVVDDV